MVEKGHWFSPKFWFLRPMRLHFLCAHSLEPVALKDGEDGYEVSNPREWVVKAAPMLKCCSTAARHRHQCRPVALASTQPFQ